MVTLIKEIPKLDVSSAAYTKICCGAAAYSEYEKIALFWKQTDDNNNITALISLIDGVMTLFNISADIFELKEFTKCISPHGVFTDMATADKLNLKIETPCDTLMFLPPKDFECIKPNEFLGLDFAVDTVSSRLDIGDKGVFKADISHRIRHNCANFVTTQNSAAFIIYNSFTAIVSGIAVKKNTEKKGVGSATLKLLISAVYPRPVFVCAEEKNTPFYLKNGFELKEKYAYCRL